MADSDKDHKAHSSTGKAKAKTSMLDDDISKDFLSSWKSMSVTGGDDMDFDFAPVAKGKKKSFDFGMDMDFSMDDPFGKMPSFKLDMPDIDFSSSPKKSTKPTEKSEEESAKGNLQQKHDKFDFSFDFNGMDDLNLDVPSTKGGKTASGEQSSKHVGSTPENEPEDLPKQMSSNNGAAASEDAISESAPESRDVISISEDLVEDRSITNASFGNTPSNSTVSVDPIQPKGAQNSLEKKLAVDYQETDPQSRVAGDSSSRHLYAGGKSHYFSTIPKSNPSQSIVLPMQVESEEAHASPETCRSVTSQSKEEEIHRAEERNSKQTSARLEESVISATFSFEKASAQARISQAMTVCSPAGKSSEGSSEGGTNSKQTSAHLKEPVKSATFLMEKASSLATISDTMEVYSPAGKPSEGSSEGGTLPGELSTSATLTSPSEKLEPEKSSPQCSTDKQAITDKKNVLGDVKTSSAGILSLDTKVPSVSSVSKTGSSAAKSLSPFRRFDQLPVTPSRSLPGSRLKKTLTGLGRTNAETQRSISKEFSAPLGRNIATNRQSSTPVMQDNPKSMGNVEKTARSQVMNEVASLVEKQNPSSPTLKRKLSEAAGVDPEMLHPSKRLSPSESRMSKVSAREVENAVQTKATMSGGSRKNVAAEYLSPTFDFREEANMDDLGFTLMSETDANVEKAEACAKELDDICHMLKKKHEEAKELLVRALLNNNNLLMLNHPICQEKIRAVERFASRLMSKEQEAGV